MIKPFTKNSTESDKKCLFWPNWKIVGRVNSTAFKIYKISSGEQCNFSSC